MQRPDPPAAWWSEMDPLDALAHIAWALHSLLYGVEDSDTLDECQDAADVWMVDVPRIIEEARRVAA